MQRNDEALARAARRKEAAGQRPSREEAAALRRVRKRAEEELRLEFYGSIPKKLWRQWSGRQQKTLDEQAQRYGVPLEGPTIELSAVVRWLHDFLRANARKLTAEERDEPDHAKLKLREEYLLARAKRRALEGRYVDCHQIRLPLQRFAVHIRTAGEILQRTYGPAALKILNDRLELAQDELRESLPDRD